MNNSEYRIPVFEEVRCLISKNKKSNTVADTGVYGLVNGGFEFFSVILLNGAHALIPWVFPKPIHRFRSNTIQRRTTEQNGVNTESKPGHKTNNVLRTWLNQPPTLPNKK